MNVLPSSKWDCFSFPSCIIQQKIVFLLWKTIRFSINSITVMCFNVLLNNWYYVMKWNASFDSLLLRSRKKLLKGISACLGHKGNSFNYRFHFSSASNLSKTWNDFYKCEIFSQNTRDVSNERLPSAFSASILGYRNFICGKWKADIFSIVCFSLMRKLLNQHEHWMFNKQQYTRVRVWSCEIDFE